MTLNKYILKCFIEIERNSIDDASLFTVGVKIPKKEINTKITLTSGMDLGNTFN